MQAEIKVSREVFSNQVGKSHITSFQIFISKGCGSTGSIMQSWNFGYNFLKRGFCCTWLDLPLSLPLSDSLLLWFELSLRCAGSGSLHFTVQLCRLCDSFTRSHNRGRRMERLCRSRVYSVAGTSESSRLLFESDKTRICVINDAFFQFLPNFK